MLNEEYLKKRAERELTRAAFEELENIVCRYGTKDATAKAEALSIFKKKLLEDRVFAVACVDAIFEGVSADANVACSFRDFITALAGMRK